jgi:glucose-6-phosphate 1-epimerase
MSAIIPENRFVFHGLEGLCIEASDGARAIVTLGGAQVVSWIPAGGQEQLFVSERSAFTPGLPVRGGIPVVFPQFSNRGPLPKHGFARNQPWRITSMGNSRAVFALDACAETRQLWPHEFALELAVAVEGATLDLQLTVRNPGPASFSFTAALHSYLSVSDATRVRLEGLPGVEHLERGLDRVYPDTPRETRLHDAGRVLTITQREFRDTVVWNPGRERSTSLADMAPLAFMNMLCVEAAAVEAPIELAAGAQWSGGQTLRAA